MNDIDLVKAALTAIEAGDFPSLPQTYIRAFIREYARIGSRVIIHNGTVIGSDGFGYVQEGARRAREARARRRQLSCPSAAFGTRFLNMRHPLG